MFCKYCISLFSHLTFFNWEDGFQQQALTEVNIRKLVLDIQCTKEALAMIDTVSAVIPDINPKLI